MRIKLDENLPHGLQSALHELGHDVHTVPQESLGGASDAELWIAIQREDRFLITQDLDFADNRKYPPGTHGGIMVVRLRDPSWQALMDCVTRVFRFEPIEQWAGSLVIVSDSRIRVRFAKPPARPQ